MKLLSQSIFYLFILSFHLQAKEAPLYIEKNLGCGNGNDCCAFDIEWQVLNNKKVVNQNFSEPIVGYVEKGDKVIALEAISRMKRGKVKALYNSNGVEKDQEVFIYSPEYEDYQIYMWLEGKITKNTSWTLNQAKPKCQNSCWGEIIHPTKTKTFIKVRLKNKKEGWLALEDLEPSC